MSPLDRKLLRDLRRMKGQAAAIAAVMALGVLMLVMMDGLLNSLSETRATYYERHRLADIFAPVARAPLRVVDRLADIDGVAAAEGRVQGSALVDMPGLKVPARALAVSLPEFGAPKLNGFYLAAGRLPEPGRGDEVLLIRGFATAHDLGPGDDLPVTLNGTRHTLRITGLAEAPEFLYSAPPGEMMPDDARFAVIWMSARVLSSAYDMDGAFNEALLALERDADARDVIAAVDRVLEPVGGLGAYGREDHTSDRFISEEISGLRVNRRTVPPVFLAVAAFLLNIVVSRMLQAEREQIGLLKAFGYSSLEVGGHYLKFILVIAVGGAVVGCLLGIWSGRAMAGVFQAYYKFPFLVFRVDPAAFLAGLAVSVLAAVAGGAFVLQEVFRLTPAVAMRPAAPEDYSRAAKISGLASTLLDQPSRMVIRRLVRQPLRSLVAVSGIAAGMALSVAMISLMSAFDVTIERNFALIDRADATVAFFDPLGDRAIYDLESLDGVLSVEPFRSVPVILSSGVRSHSGSISGLVEEPRLNRAVGADLSPLRMREQGLVLGVPLAQKLQVNPGDRLTVEVREGRRPVLEIPVTGVAETMMGAPAYMEISALNRALGEPGRVSGAYLAIDQTASAGLYAELREMPGVAGVSLRDDVRAGLERMVDSGAGALRYVMAAIAGVITFGIVYNSARIAFAERARDLASLRVLGFTRGEASFVLLGELAAIILVALPAGGLLGWLLAGAMAAGFSTDLYQVPSVFTPESYGVAALAVLAAAAVSGWLVKRDVDRLDLVSALKTRE